MGFGGGWIDLAGQEQTAHTNSNTVTTVGMGFVKSWGALAGCRVVLGTFEAGLYPGCVYLLGMLSEQTVCPRQ